MTKERDRPKRQPTGDYETGYCRPPVSGQFTSDQSHINRRSRTLKRSADIAPVSDAAIKEAARMVDVRNGEAVERLSVYDANLRALGVHGVKGSRLHASEFLNRADRAAERSRREVEEWSTAVYQLKENWLHYKELHRARFGTEPPPPVPHPDDLIIDPDTGQYVIDGPSNHDERDALHELLKLLKMIRRKVLLHRTRWLQDPVDSENIFDMLFYAHLFVSRNDQLPDRYKLPRLPRTPASRLSPSHAAYLEQLAEAA